jgi:hypothetical protein
VLSCSHFPLQCVVWPIQKWNTFPGGKVISLFVKAHVGSLNPVGSFQCNRAGNKLVLPHSSRLVQNLGSHETRYKDTRNVYPATSSAFLLANTVIKAKRDVAILHACQVAQKRLRGKINSLVYRIGRSRWFCLLSLRSFIHIPQITSFHAPPTLAMTD